MIQYADLLGKPFEYGGRGPDSFDCFGLVMEVHKRHGNELPDYISRADSEYQCNMFSHGIANYYEQVEKPEPLDIVMFQILPRFVTHCGVIVDQYGKFVHITRKTSVSCERIDSLLWKDKIRGFYRYKGND